MLKILYEDDQIIVVKKPVGIESQSARSFAPDMVSEIKKHIHKLSTKSVDIYVGVIHRLDKPVSGVMVYAKTKNAAAILSKDVQEGNMNKQYLAVVCGKPVDIVGNYVDYLLKNAKTNLSTVVDKDTSGAKRAELRYHVIDEIQCENRTLSLLDITLLTGRHHQIRLQMSAHGTPLWGDQKYNPEFADKNIRANVALCAYKLVFNHPVTKKKMEFQIIPDEKIFKNFQINV